LAIYAFSKRKDISADAKLQWLLKNNLLYEFRPEVFKFLECSYPSAKDGMKRRIIARVLKGQDVVIDEAEAHTGQYRIYNMMVWLARIAPDSQITRKAFEEIQQKHPDFAPSPKPDAIFWLSDVEPVETTKGFNIKQIASEPPSEFLNKLDSWRPPNEFDEPRPHFCTVVRLVSTENPEWGIHWLETLKSQGLTDPDLWECVPQGWRNAQLSRDQCRVILQFAQTVEVPAKFLVSFVDVLEHGASREQHALPDDLMEEAQNVAERIWNLALVSTVSEQRRHTDWLTLAVNRPGGKLALFWLQRISSARRAAHNSWSGLPGPIANSISEILRASAGAAELARTVFASQLHYFFSLDAEFAMRDVIPLFDWQREPKTAEQSWSGFLMWGRWLGGFVEQLLPQFDNMITHLEVFPKDIREHAIDDVAELALFQLDNPVASGWLWNVLHELSTDDISHLATRIDWLLKSTDSVLVERIWGRWLRDYWEKRLLGVPIPLSSTEATRMVYWAASAGSKVSEAVKLVHRMGDFGEFQHGDFLYRLNEKCLAKTQPETCADLVLFYLQHTKHLFPADCVSTLWRDLKESGVPQQKLERIREAMFNLGFDPEDK
jgi:hypothetical protein